MHRIDDNCLLCLDSLGSITILSTPRYCNCNVYIHDNCLLEIEQSGLACPICRLKFPLTKENYNINLMPSYNGILEYPMFLLVNNLNIFTFILLIFYTFAVTFLYILPKLLYIFTKEYIKVRYMRSNISFR
jgi:hypothetical protein